MKHAAASWRVNCFRIRHRSDGVSIVRVMYYQVYQIRPHDGKRTLLTLVKIVSGTMCAAVSLSISLFKEKYSLLFG
jgi:hypothetical protein